jgi:hypothetical protein
LKAVIIKEIIKIKVMKKVFVAQGGCRGEFDSLEVVEIETSLRDYALAIGAEVVEETLEGCDTEEDVENVEEMIDDLGIGCVNEYEFRGTLAYSVILNEEEGLYIFEKDVVTEEDEAWLDEMQGINELEIFLGIW